MISSTPAYRAAITGDSRRIYVTAVLGIFSPDLTYGPVTGSAQAQAVSRPLQIHNEVTELSANYASLEANRWVLDGTVDLLPDDTAALAGESGFVGAALSGADGGFSTEQWVELALDNIPVLQVCTLWFPTARGDGIPSDFTVEIRQGGAVYYSETFAGNTDSYIRLGKFTVYRPDAIRVRVARWSLPGRRLRLAEFMPGLYERLDGGSIQSIAVKHQADVSCLSLPYGTVSLVIDNADRRFDPRNKSGIFLSIEERQSIPISIGVELPDGTVEYKRVGMFYQYSGGWKTSNNSVTIQWSLVDIVGLLSDRVFLPPEELPTTLAGWLEALAGQLGENFRDRWHADPNYAGLPLTVDDRAEVEGLRCGDLLRYACMATGTWPRADAETGFLTAEPLWNQGNKLTLDNLNDYPTMKANGDVAALVFTLNDGEKTQVVVSGNSAASSETRSINNPFIRTRAQALTAARSILATCGGTRLELTGRGDPSSELGDVDTVWLDESSAATARRIQQSFSFTSGVLQRCASVLLQADGSFLYQNRTELTSSGSWTAPAGVTSLRLILVGRGETGGDGTDGSWEEAGQDGLDGAGGKVWYGTISVNPGERFTVSVGAETAFGAYSSADGKVYPYGYTDVASGNSYGRTGVEMPLPGTGDGGKGGTGGVKGNRHEERQTITSYDGLTGSVISSATWTVTVVDNEPGAGGAGAVGAAGCAVVYWSNPFS